VIIFAAVAVRAGAFVTAFETVLVMTVNAINIIGPNNSATVAAAGRFDFNPFCFLLALLLLQSANLKPTCDFFKGEDDALLFVLLISHLGDEPSRLLLELRP
jgi:hypothetical protein